MIEKELEIPESNLPIYTLFPDSSGGGWRVQAVPLPMDGFKSRKPLPEAWRGIRDDALDVVTGIPGCVFVHGTFT